MRQITEWKRSSKALAGGSTARGEPAAVLQARNPRAWMQARVVDTTAERRLGTHLSREDEMKLFQKNL